MLGPGAARGADACGDDAVNTAKSRNDSKPASMSATAEALSMMNGPLQGSIAYDSGFLDLWIPLRFLDELAPNWERV